MRDAMKETEAEVEMVTLSDARRRLLVFVLVFALAALFLICAISVGRETRGPRLFRQYTLDPIPTSVAHIRVDQPKTHGGYGYVFRFSIDQADFELIRASQPFREARNVTYGKGVLMWDWESWDSRTSHGEESGGGFGPYAMVREPSWLDLASWQDPDAYVLATEDEDTEVRDTRVLLYDKKRGEAYYIVFHYDLRGLW